MTSLFHCVELVSPTEMAAADRLAADAGVPTVELMRRAADAVASTVLEEASGAGAIAVLAGPGNNGGDAYGAARILREAGREVELFALGTPQGADAQLMGKEWGAPARELADFDPEGFAVVVDGLFGGGLSRPLDGPVARAITRLSEVRPLTVAIDLPSGIDGATGQVQGVAVQADVTVTFERRKPGHLLLPGREHCGRTVVAPIGLTAAVIAGVSPTTYANEPELWRDHLLEPQDVHHKYDRGHAVVFSGGASSTGAARLSAMAALRAGAGLVTVFSPASALLVNASHLTAIMLRRCEDEAELLGHLEDERLLSFVLGPGFGDPGRARAFASAVMKAGRCLVLDADGISAFADAPGTLFDAARASTGGVVLTPHAGEFGRIFPDLTKLVKADKPKAAREAAARSGATVLLKGSDTVVAAPDGRASINAAGTPVLATAGTGDVLAGLIAAQLANGVPAFEAASAAAWIHGRAARRFGVGLIAEDLPRLVPNVLAELQEYPA